MGAYAPSGVMVGHKVLLTPESPKDVADAVWLARFPLISLCVTLHVNFGDTSKAVKKDSLTTKKFYRVFQHLLRRSIKDAKAAVVVRVVVLEKEVQMSHVSGEYISPSSKHLGNHSLSVLDDDAAGTSMPVETRSEVGNLDAYALKEASLPTTCPQSQVDIYDLFETCKKCGQVAHLSFLAATRSLSKLHEGGIRILSLYEVFVFMYNWDIDAAGHGYDQLALTPEGWRVQALGGDSPARSPLGSVRGGLNSTLGVPSVSAVPGEGGSDPEKACPDGIGVQGGMSFLRGLLVVAVGSRNGKPPCLQSLVFQRVSSEPFRHMVTGLQRYAKAKEEFVVEGLQPQGSRDKSRAEMVVRAGIGLWPNISSVEALQLAPTPGTVPHQSAGVNSKIEGFGIVFRDTSNDTYSFMMPDGTRRPHPYTGISCGTFLGPDGPHQANHNDECREKYAGI